MAGDGLDRMAITIAGDKIHLPVNPGRIEAQRLLDLAHVLHKLLPVHGAQETQAGDAVADGNLVGGLVLALEVDQLLDGKSLLHEPLLEPAPRQVHRRALARQALQRTPPRTSWTTAARTAPCRPPRRRGERDSSPPSPASDRPTGPPGRDRAGRSSGRVVTRCRFSIKPSRSMIGMAHNSPSFKGDTVW